MAILWHSALPRLFKQFEFCEIVKSLVLVFISKMIQKVKLILNCGICILFFHSLVQVAVSEESFSSIYFAFCIEEKGIY